MGTSRAVAFVAALSVVGPLSLGCTGGDDEANERVDVSGQDRAQLAEHLACDRTGRGSRRAWDEQPALECFDDGWSATIHAPLEPGTLSSGLTLLGMRYEPGPYLNPCPDGRDLDDVAVIAGDTWIVVVSNKAGADRVLERFGGEIQPRDNTGPPVSYGFPCPDRSD